MTGNYFTLLHLARRLNEALPGQTIAGAFSQERDELVLAIGTSHVVVSCRPEENTLFLHPGYSRARANTADLLRVATGRTVLAVAIDASDRIVRLHLDGEFTLACRFFGGRACVLLQDGVGRTVESFRTSPSDDDRHRAATADAPFFDAVRLQELLEASPGVPVSRVVRQAVPQLGPDLAREVVFRAGLREEMLAGDMPVTAIARVIGAIGELLIALETALPVVYSGPEGTLPLFSPVALRSMADRDRREFDDIHEAVRTTVYRRRALVAADRERSGMLDALRKEIDRLDRAIGSLDEGADEHGRADLYERYGALLLAHQASIARGSAAVTLGDGETAHQIQLEPRLSAVRNAQRYFDRAKRARAAREEATRRRPPLLERRTRALRILEDIGSLRDRAALKDYAGRHQPELADFGIGPKAREREQIPFRIFTVDGGFEVWAGKSSENNDLLTLRHARPNDLWFHARGAGGSHVVLRVATAAGEPGKRARQQAASIAAYYSKLRNAGSVPVAMTRKKFVRKPRGAPAGTVVLEREEVLIVPPELPRESPPAPRASVRSPGRD